MGSTFQNLTKSGVQDDGKTEYYDHPGDAELALAKKDAGAMQPSTMLSTGTLGTVAPDGNPTPDNYSITPTDPGVPSAQVVHPSFAQAEPGALTTKGQILRTVLAAGAGGLAGAGQRTIGAGFQQGMTLPYEIAQQKANMQHANQQNQQSAAQTELLKAKVANLPFTRAAKEADVNLKNAETAYYTEGRSMGTPETRATFTGVHPELFPDEDSKQAYILFGSRQPKPGLGETVDGRKQIIEGLKTQYGKSYGLSPDDEQQYILNGKLKEGTDRQDTAVTLALKAASGDQHAKSALSLYGNATRPNYTLGNQEAKDDRDKEFAGNAAALGARAMAANGADHKKAIAQLNQFVAAQKLKGRDAAIAQEAIRQLEAERRASMDRGNAALDAIKTFLNNAGPPK